MPGPQYTQTKPVIVEALGAFKKEVQDQSFPAKEHSFSMPQSAQDELKQI